MILSRCSIVEFIYFILLFLIVLLNNLLNFCIGFVYYILISMAQFDDEKVALQFHIFIIYIRANTQT